MKRVAADIGFFEERYCPWHGERIRLADCPIVATNEAYEQEVRSRLRAARAAPFVSLQENSLGEARINAVLGESVGKSVPSSGVSPGSERLLTSISSLAVGDLLESAIDGKGRLVVSLPPRPPVLPEKRRYGRVDEPRLPSPAELAAPLGGPRLRPVRACPDARCLHPLPAGIDTRDVFVVAVIGNTSASKTTLLAALADMASAPEGRAVLGLADFAVTEDSARRFQEILRGYRMGSATVVTPSEEFGFLEVNFSFSDGSLPEGVLVLHNLGGENYQDPDKRLHRAAHVLWSDAVVFVVNPEETPGINTARSDVDQAQVLSGLLDDLRSFDRSIPALYCAISKADLLPAAFGIGSGRSVQTFPSARDVLVALGAHDVVAAAERWPTVFWSCVAPQPVDGGPYGVLELFAGVLGEMAEKGRQGGAVGASSRRLIPYVPTQDVGLPARPESGGSAGGSTSRPGRSTGEVARVGAEAQKGWPSPGETEGLQADQDLFRISENPEQKGGTRSQSADQASRGDRHRAAKTDQRKSHNWKRSGPHWVCASQTKPHSDCGPKPQGRGFFRGWSTVVLDDAGEVRREFHYEPEGSVALQGLLVLGAVAAVALSLVLAAFDLTGRAGGLWGLIRPQTWGGQVPVLEAGGVIVIISTGVLGSVRFLPGRVIAWLLGLAGFYFVCATLLSFIPAPVWATTASLDELRLELLDEPLQFSGMSVLPRSLRRVSVVASAVGNIMY